MYFLYIILNNENCIYKEILMKISPPREWEDEREREKEQKKENENGKKRSWEEF